jgi:small GTP-binding protein
MFNQEKENIFTFLGTEKSGKTGIINAFFGLGFVEEHQPTIDIVYNNKLEIDGVEQFFKIVDTGGKLFSNIGESWIEEATGFILVFDVRQILKKKINDHNSFLKLQNIKKAILEINQETLPVVLVGNKSDLEKNVKTTEIEDFCLHFYKNTKGSIPYIEVSSKTKENVKKLNKIIRFFIYLKKF